MLLFTSLPDNVDAERGRLNVEEEQAQVQEALILVGLEPVLGNQLGSDLDVVGNHGRSVPDDPAARPAPAGTKAGFRLRGA